MPKQIWVGPVLSGNRSRLIERCSTLISDNRADSFLYLTASYPLLELVTAGLLHPERNAGVWGSLPVYLFRGFVKHLLATAVEEGDDELVLPPRISIDRDELPLKRSLIAQIITGLARAGRLNAIAPLAHSEGCVNSVASLIGEIQRAARTPDEFEAIVKARARDLYERIEDEAGTVFRQIDFDREIALIYSSYAASLDRFRLTEDDADQLRALSVLRGEVDGKQVRLPWLDKVRVLVLDGFFDFTPVQGEMLRLLIPQVPEVIVNLNGDERNRDIFRPYEATIEQLCSIADFELRMITEERPVAGQLAKLRSGLFNPSANQDSNKVEDPGAIEEHAPVEPNIRLLECSDRETEIRAIAKEIKRLVLLEDYSLREIALVVRQRASYSDAIARIFQDEAIPCAIERRGALGEVPAVRAALKLFRLLREIPDETRGQGAGNAKVGDLADLLKSEYFRPSVEDVTSLRSKFDREYEALLVKARKDGARVPAVWDVDELENVIAFVGGELRVADWLARARRVMGRIPKPQDSDLTEDEETEADGLVSLDAESESGIENPPEIEQAGSEVKPKPSREVHPVAIAWAGTLIEHLIGLIDQTPREGQPAELRQAVLLLLERLEFAGQIKLRSLSSVAELPRATLDMRGLEGMRQAFTAAIRSIEIADAVVGDAAEEAGREPQSIRLPELLDELMRCLRGQTLAMIAGDRDGLQILEATDVRGLHFRSIFVAGLIEGGFPLRTPRDWIYPYEEREQLSQYGLTLEDISPATLLKEEHYFYQSVCRATERLYLSRPLMLEGDAETVASYYIEELKQAVRPSRIASKTVRRDFDGRELFAASTAREIAVSLVRQSERLRHPAQSGDVLPPAYIEAMIRWAREESYLSPSAWNRIRIEHERAGKSFTCFDGEIADPELIEMLDEQFGMGHSFSASQLSLYGECPFKFYAKQVLKLEPRGEAALDLKALDAGRLLHEVLRRFFERHRLEQLTSLPREELRAELQRVADKVFDEYERVVPPLNPRVWRIDREIRKILLDQVLVYELSLQQGRKAEKRLRPAFFELGFGMMDDEGDPNSTERSLEFSRPAPLNERPETVSIRGRIDRVDVAEDGTVIAYDYKLSKGGSLVDMREGRDLQLGIYLTALERIFLPHNPIAGGGYYVLRGKQDRRNRGLFRKSFVEYTQLGAVMANCADEVWLEVRREMETRIWEFIDGMRAGSFRVMPSAPKDSCPRCDFAAVCRYETFRIRGKE